MRLLVDGMNVIGSRPDGWWRDREGAMRRLVEALAHRAVETGEEITVVLDARPFDLGEAAAGVSVCFAPGGRNAGDDEIVRIVERDPAPEMLHVVTSDRDLAQRVRELGANVVPAREFRASLAPFERA
jgi:predicted RNA-binding protein with PIN domain